MFKVIFVVGGINFELTLKSKLDHFNCKSAEMGMKKKVHLAGFRGPIPADVTSQRATAKVRTLRSVPATDSGRILRSLPSAEPIRFTFTLSHKSSSQSDSTLLIKNQFALIIISFN